MYFSRKRQESAIESLERDFYKMLLSHKEGGEGSGAAYKLSSRIHHMISQHYFESDLLEYLTHLDVCVVSYIKPIVQKIPFEKKKMST